ncbi:MAG: glycosyltransferase family 39 protein [Thermomicrobiales bacterium]
MNAERGTQKAELTGGEAGAGVVGRRGASTFGVARVAFVSAALVLYLLWLGRGELGWLPGGQWAALGGWAVLAALLLVIWLWRAGYLARWWAVVHVAPSGALLIVIVLIAAVPRLVALPGAAPPPMALAAEQEALGEARRMVTTGQFRPVTFARPSALLYLQTASGAAAFLLGASNDRWHDVSAMQPADLATPAHLLNALLGLLTIALVYATSRRLYSPRAGLLAAALLACSPLAWRAAHVADESTLAALAAMLALWGIVDCGLRIANWWESRHWLFEEGTALSRQNPQSPPARGFPVHIPHCLVAAFLLGLATGIRPALLLLVAPLVLALWWGGRMRVAIVGLLLTAGVVGFLVAAPYALAALPAMLDASASTARGYDLRVTPGTLALLVRHVPDGALLFSRAEPLLALLGSVGALIALLRRQRGDWLVLAALVPGLLLVLLHRSLDAWQFIPYTPFLALLGGLALDTGWTSLAAHPHSTARRKQRSRKRPSAA